MIANINQSFERLREDFYALERKVKKLESVYGFGRCPYCNSEISRQYIEKEILIIKTEIAKLQPDFEIQQKIESERLKQLWDQSKQEEKIFKALCTQLKPTLLPKIRHIAKLHMNDLQAPITLPSLSEDHKNVWDHLMETYMDDENERDEFATDPELYYTKYHH